MQAQALETPGPAPAVSTLRFNSVAGPGTARREAVGKNCLNSPDSSSYLPSRHCMFGDAPRARRQPTRVLKQPLPSPGRSSRRCQPSTVSRGQRRMSAKIARPMSAPAPPLGSPGTVVARSISKWAGLSGTRWKGPDGPAEPELAITRVARPNAAPPCSWNSCRHPVLSALPLPSHSVRMPAANSRPKRSSREITMAGTGL